MEIFRGNYKKLLIQITLVITLYLISIENVVAWDSTIENLMSRSTKEDLKHITKRYAGTHRKITEQAIHALRYSFPKLKRYASEIVAGANTELHEREVDNCVLEDLRKKSWGTNAGCKYPAIWWLESVKKFKSGKVDEAFFYLGVLLHMIEDQGVPSHAWEIEHQALNPSDNFEKLALLCWNPDYDTVDKVDPKYLSPYKYYKFSKEWTIEDTEHWNGRYKRWNKTNSFRVGLGFWLTATKQERILLRCRQARTVKVTMWTLNSACMFFKSLGW